LASIGFLFDRNCYGQRYKVTIGAVGASYFMEDSKQQAFSTAPKTVSLVQVCGEYIFDIRMEWRNYVIFYNIYREHRYNNQVRRENGNKVSLSFVDVLVTKI
jgi:hypothetical protein